MKTYTFNEKHSDILKLQRCLNEVLKLDMKPDGHFGKLTQNALQLYQAKYGIVEKDATGPVYGPITQQHTSAFINRKYIKESDFVDAAKKSGLEINVIKAVTEVEALGFGFYNNGKPVMLFERHIFYKELAKSKGTKVADSYAQKFPDICNKSTGGYIGGASELARLDKASKAIVELDIGNNIALLSASYGLFQIMGFNFKQAGFKTVQDYYNSICLSEQEQLNAFVNYILLDSDKSLFNSLKRRDFTSFAKEYNGPGYAKNRYDTKMQTVYNRLSKK
jgi:peptidoglycan hydrolase-like protein with peptidoglycan-binding domain